MSERFPSPLRYPGGKTRLAPFISALIRDQPERPSVYGEPFAGGAGAALKLLFDENVSSVAINDLNPGIAAFWRVATRESRALAERVEAADVSLRTWHWASEVYGAQPMDVSDADLAFATFFLNRTNRSGILHARPIGGMEQGGSWKIDARFNREELAERIARVGDYGSRIDVYEMDAKDFIGEMEKKFASDVLLYVDPPYLGQGDGLYMNSLTFEDHRQLADRLRASDTRWLLTYDADDRVKSTLYGGMRCLEFRIAHTASRQHVGVEWAVFSKRLRVATVEVLPAAEAEWIVA